MAIPPTDIRILFTNYDIIAYFLSLASCSEHFISIKHRILATFNINEKKKILRACMPLIVSYWCLISCYLLQVLRTNYFYRDQYSVSFLLALRLKRTCRCWVGVGGWSPRCVSVSSQRFIGHAWCRAIWIMKLEGVGVCLRPVSEFGYITVEF